MVNIVVTSTTNSILVDFNDYSSSVGYSKGTWSKNGVKHVILKSTHVEVYSEYTNPCY